MCRLADDTEVSTVVPVHRGVELGTGLVRSIDAIWNPAWENGGCEHE